MIRRQHIIALFLAFGMLATAADWPQWRGIHRDGISSETGLLDTWPAGGPRLMWKAQGLGEGYSSFSVVGNRLYTQGQSGEEEYVIALDVATGKTVWKTPTGRAYREERGNGPRGTPTTDGSRLYAVAADGTVVCLEMTTGKKVWALNMPQQFGGSVPRWGYSESPLVDGDLVIVTPGGPGASVVALQKETGKVIWKSQSDPAAYSSPMAVDFGGTRMVIVLTARGALGLGVKEGELRWRYDNVANRVANIATPILRDNHIFLSTDYGTGCGLLKLASSGGSISATEVYFNRDMRNHYTTSVLVGDTLYGFSSSTLTAMNFQTGAVAWRDRSVGKGNCIFAEKNLYCLGEDGSMGLIEATPTAYREKSRFRISPGERPTWTPPVIADGKLYQREQDNLYCYSIKR